MTGPVRRRSAQVPPGALVAFLLVLGPGCATTTVEERVIDPTAVAEARAADRAAGTASAPELIVVLRLKIGADGAVRDAQVVQSGGTKADDAALKAVRRLHFNPAHTEDGQPVESTIRFAFKFSPDG